MSCPNELLKTLVNSEFGDFIPIEYPNNPRYMGCYRCQLLDIVVVDDLKMMHRREEAEETVVTPDVSSAFTNVGPLSLKTKQAMDVEKLINKAKEEKICIYDHPTYSSTKANLKLGVGIKPHSEKTLNLGEIRKKSLSYEQIAEMLTKLSFTEDFIKLVRKTHLYIIYEVLYAEKLEILQSISTKTTTGSTRNSGNGKGFSVEKEIQHGKSWWYPEKLGERPIAYKCGEIRLICHKGDKKSFRLANMDKFYQPFDATCTDDDSHIHTCKEQSLKRLLESF